MGQNLKYTLPDISVDILTCNVHQLKKLIFYFDNSNRMDFFHTSRLIGQIQQKNIYF